FAACFLQIPRHRGHPCIKLTTTTAFMVRDFHPIDCTHAGRTKKVAAATSLFNIKQPLFEQNFSFNYQITQN
ncbi:hypothetical protein NGI46_26290, partial [Peribacillus butanolivorans]|uniref:hypothetical protein n=1 Tax=Peribacillus butanolivorans TaxID=421767 RepID=UPI00207CCB30